MKPEEFAGICRRTETAVKLMNPSELDTFTLHLEMDQLVADLVKLVTEVQLLNKVVENQAAEKVALNEKVGQLVEQLRARDMRLG